MKPVFPHRLSVLNLFLFVILFALYASAEAQQPKNKLPRIGYLSSLNRATESARLETIRGAMRELGYTEGENVIIEYRYADGKQDRFSELASEIVRLKVDLIVTAGGDVLTRAAKNATNTIPIVMVGPGLDPVDAGLVESLARPGGNVTGLTTHFRELGGKRLEVFKQAVPKLSRVAVLYDPSIPPNVFEVNEVLPPAARVLGLKMFVFEIRRADELDKFFAAVDRQRPDGLYVPEGRIQRANGQRIAQYALNSRLPSIYDSKPAVETGGLMYYGANLSDSYRRVAYFIDRILKGANPAELPVEQPTKFELVINLKTAKQIGLMVPPNVLARADRVIR